MNTDVDAVVYLMLVNNVLHDLFPSAITIGARVATARRRLVWVGFWVRVQGGWLLTRARRRNSAANQRPHAPTPS